MKRTKLLKHLHRHGCRFEREGGNHTIYTNADGTRKTVIPRHPEIKPNTVRKICKDVSTPPPEESKRFTWTIPAIHVTLSFVYTT